VIALQSVPMIFQRYLIGGLTAGGAKGQPPIRSYFDKEVVIDVDPDGFRGRNLS
jgi:hypothetical protein